MTLPDGVISGRFLVAFGTGETLRSSAYTAVGEVLGKTLSTMAEYQADFTGRCGIPWLTQMGG